MGIEGGNGEQDNGDKKKRSGRIVDFPGKEELQRRYSELNKEAPPEGGETKFFPAVERATAGAGRLDGFVVDILDVLDITIERMHGEKQDREVEEDPQESLEQYETLRAALREALDEMREARIELERNQNDPEQLQKFMDSAQILRNELIEAQPILGFEEEE